MARIPRMPRRPRVPRTPRRSATPATPGTPSTPGTPTTPPTPTTATTPVTPPQPVLVGASGGGGGIPPIPPTVTAGPAVPPPNPPIVTTDPVTSLVPSVDEYSATGVDLVARGMQHLGEEYILGARAPMGNANWVGPWDCAEFCSWCVYQETGLLYGVNNKHDPMLADAYTGFWAQDAQTYGQIVSTEDALSIAGACLLRKPATGRTGHIVFSDGQGGTVEAHSRVRGVITHTALGRRWDYGVLVPGVQYFMNENPVPMEAIGPIYRLMSPLMRGTKVLQIQTILATKGYSVGDVDGVFGPQTESAVVLFQEDEGLVADGEVGKATLEKLGL